MPSLPLPKEVFRLVVEAVDAVESAEELEMVGLMVVGPCGSDDIVSK